MLWGACDALFTPRPLAPLHDVALQTRGALQAAVDSHASPAALFAYTLGELGTHKTLLILEDLHWADEATLDLFTFLGRRIHRTRTLLVASYREDELGERHPLRLALGGLPPVATLRMPLAPLSEAAVAQLATEAGRPAKGLHGITGGNPLFVTEVLAAGTETVPPTVRDAVLARAARLTPAARTLAELVCVVPGRAESWVLAQAADADEGAIEGCLRIGMVRHDDGSLAFRHELARRALEDSLSQPRRQRLHATVLEVLAARPDVSPARMAHHADGARDGSKVLRYGPLAAREAAAVGAHREAATHYRAALRYADGLPLAERAALQEQLRYECYLTSAYKQGFEAQQSALEIWRALGERLKEGEALTWLSRLTWFLGDTAQANRYCDAAIATLESMAPGAELALACWARADLAMEAHEAELCIESAQRAIALAQAASARKIVAHSWGTLGTMRLIVGDPLGWADLNHSLELALTDGLEAEVASAYTNMLAMAVSRRQYEQAGAYLRAGLAYCEERDLDFLVPYMLAYGARMKFEQGHWNEASTDIEAVLHHPHTTAVTRIPALRTLAHLRVRRGDPDVSGPVAEARALAGPTPELQRSGMLALVCAEAAWLAGDPAGVVREVETVWELARRRRDPRMNGELAAWLWRAGALEQLPLLDIAEPYAREIAGEWRAAAAAWKMFGCPYEHGCMLAWYGNEAEQRQALAIFEGLGAAPAARSLRRQMRARGIRRIPRGSHASTRRHPFGLTQREAEILALLAEGVRTSMIARRLFLAPKTVEHHVSAILAKLGVSSRAEAIAQLRKHSERAPASDS